MNDNVIHANFNRTVTSAPENRKQTYIGHNLPAWVLINDQLRRDCWELGKAGFEIHLLTLPGVQQVLFSHADIKPVPPRLFNVEEANFYLMAMKNARGNGGAA